MRGNISDPKHWLDSHDGFSFEDKLTYICCQKAIDVSIVLKYCLKELKLFHLFNDFILWSDLGFSVLN